MPWPSAYNKLGSTVGPNVTCPKQFLDKLYKRAFLGLQEFGLILNNLFLCAYSRKMLVRRIRPALSAGARALSSFLSDTDTHTNTNTTSANIINTRGGEVCGGGRGSLVRRLLSLKYSKKSAVVTLTEWSQEGNRLQKYQINRIVRELRKYKRYKHALEVSKAELVIAV
jgi:hypothetical protein